MTNWLSSSIWGHSVFNRVLNNLFEGFRANNFQLMDKVLRIKVIVLGQRARQLIHQRLVICGFPDSRNVGHSSWYLATPAVLILEERKINISLPGDFFTGLTHRQFTYLCCACSTRRCARKRYSIVCIRQNLFLTLVKAFPNEFLIDDNWSNIHNDITYVKLHHHTAYIMSTIYMKFFNYFLNIVLSERSGKNWELISFELKLNY